MRKLTLPVKKNKKKTAEYEIFEECKPTVKNYYK